jgi:hypothetical protein
VCVYSRCACLSKSHLPRQYTDIANVYVDGVLLQQLDGYAPGGQPQAVMYYVTGLSTGPHTLSIEVAGQKNTAATQAWVWVDAFEYTPPAR